MSDNPKITKAACAECGPDRDHLILKQHEYETSDEHAQYSTTHQMVECCGCHRISLKRIRDATFLDEVIVEYFPPVVSRKIPESIAQIVDAPDEMSELLNEVYSALYSNNRRIATMGARAVLDMMIVDKVGDVGTFELKLAALVAGKFITTQQCEFLEAALETGNAASHRGHCPTDEDVNRLMNIVEGLLSQIYALPCDGEELAKATPRRTRSTKIQAKP